MYANCMNVESCVPVQYDAHLHDCAFEYNKDFSFFIENNHPCIDI